jgi:hypothetical protein
MVVIHLQKSDFGDYFYLNIGIQVVALSEERFPKVEKCHISLRADALIDAGALSLELGLNAEEGRSEDFERSVILIKDVLLPILLTFFSIGSLREFYKKGGFKRSLIQWQAREILEGSA